MAATFIGANRSKRAIVLDLKQPAAIDALLALAQTADVLIYNMRASKMQALGLSPDMLRERFKRLIVVGIHGFAQEGPYAGRPAYDDIIQGMCGLAALSELQGGEPAYLPTVVADKTCGLFAAQAVLMALVGRAQTGQGCFVEVPMLESMVGFTLVEHLFGGHFTPAQGPMGYSRVTSNWRKPYKTTDGYVCVVPYSDAHWRRFFKEVGQPDLMDDARFTDLASRTRNIDVLYAELAKCIAARSTAQWLATCDALDIPAAPMHRLSDLQNDPQLAQSAFMRMTDPAMGELVMTSAPLRFDQAMAAPTLPPRLGQHTVEVLREAGLGADAISALLASGAAAQSNTPV